MDIDGRKVDKTPDYLRPLWYTDDGKSMDWSLCKMRKGTPNEMFRAELQELVNEKYNDHTRIYIDGSKKEEEVGYAVVTVQQSTRRRIKDQYLARSKNPS
jgi:disulfide oxidoreductase YuzD